MNDLPFKTGDFVFPTISWTLLCNGWPKAGELFFYTKLNVYVSGYCGASKCRQHSQLMKKLIGIMKIIEGAVHSQ